MPSWSASATGVHKDREAVLSVCFDPADALVFAGFFDGSVGIFAAPQLGSPVATLNVNSDVDRCTKQDPATPEAASRPAHPRLHHPVTAVVCRPAVSEYATTAPVLVIGTSSGYVLRYELTSGAASHAPRVLKESNNNEVYAAAFRADGLVFATAGLDAAVRVYDDVSFALLRTIPLQVGTKAPRAQALCFSSVVPSVAIVGGWGSTLSFVDTNGPHGVLRTVFGPFLAGSALDARGGHVVAASFRGHDRVTLLEETAAIVDRPQQSGGPELPSRTIEWPSSGGGATDISFFPLCARLSPVAAEDGEEFLLLGGGGGMGLTEGALIVSRATLEPVFALPTPGTVNACAFTNTVEKGHLSAVLGDSKGGVHILSYCA